MNRKTTAILIVAVIIACIVLAYGLNYITTYRTSSSQNEQPENGKIGKTPDNPIPFGESVILAPNTPDGADQEITVLEAKIEGLKVSVTIQIKAIGSPGKTTKYYPMYCKIVGSKGKIYDYFMNVGGEILSGHQVIEEIHFYVDEDDSNFVLMYKTSYYEPNYFFALE